MWSRWENGDEPTRLPEFYSGTGETMGRKEASNVPDQVSCDGSERYPPSARALSSTRVAAQNTPMIVAVRRPILVARHPAKALELSFGRHVGQHWGRNRLSMLTVAILTAWDHQRGGSESRSGVRLLQMACRSADWGRF